MVIRRSSSKDVEQLLATLGRGTAPPAARDTAVARLRVIGARAVPRLVDFWQAHEHPGVRTAILQALEGSADPRVTGLVLDALRDQSGEVRAAAAAAARGLLESDRSDELLDRLTALALDPSEPAPVRVSAITTLQDLPRKVIAPILGRLDGDTDATVRAAAHQDITADDTPDSLVDDAAAGDLPVDPQLLLQALEAVGAVTPQPTLHRLVKVVREREGATSDPGRRREWMAARGAVHRALASQGSRVALYDLRETVRSADARLPAGFASSLADVADPDALDDIAAAFARVSADLGDPWAADLMAAARAIVRRERLTARHAALKRLHARWGATASALLG